MVGDWGTKYIPDEADNRAQKGLHGEWFRGVGSHPADNKRPAQKAQQRNESEEFKDDPDIVIPQVRVVCTGTGMTGRRTSTAVMMMPAARHFRNSIWLIGLASKEKKQNKRQKKG